MRRGGIPWFASLGGGWEGGRRGGVQAGEGEGVGQGWGRGRVVGRGEAGDERVHAIAVVGQGR